MAVVWERADLVLEWIERLQGRSLPLGLDVFMASRDEQDMLAYRLMAVSEFAGRLPEHIQARFPEVPWLRIRGMRNRLAHDYDGISATLLWDVLHNDIPVLATVLQAIVAERLS